MQPQAAVFMLQRPASNAMIGGRKAMQAGARFHGSNGAAARLVLRSLPSLALLLALCFAQPAPADQPQVTQPDAATHQLAPGDVLAVKLYNSDKPDSLTVQVDDAGQVVLPLLQAVNV